MRREEIEEIRNILVDELEKYEGEPILLPLEPKLLNEIIFEDYYGDGFKRFYYKFKSFNLLKKIDFSNIPFTNVLLNECDLTGLKNVRIDPQIVYNNDLSNKEYNGVEFIGSFDGVICTNVDFTGSKGALINPQTIKDKSLIRCILKDVTFIGGFDGVDIIKSDFTGSKGAVIKGAGSNFSYTKLCDALIDGEVRKSILQCTDFTGAKSIDGDMIKLNPKKILNNSMVGCIFNGIRFTKEFGCCRIINCDFRGSVDAVINPSLEKNMSGCIFEGVYFSNNLDYVNIVNSDFTGSKCAVINPQKIFHKNLSHCIFNDVCFVGSFDGANIVNSNFTGSMGALINPQTIYKKDARDVNFTDVIVVDNFNGVIKNNAIMPSEDNLIDDECLVEKESSIRKIKLLFK